MKGGRNQEGYADPTAAIAVGRVIKEQKKQSELVEIQDDNMYSEWVDSVTGVHYFHTYRGGLTPRYNADGTLMTDK